MSELAKSSRIGSVVLWALSLAGTLACLAYQDRTGPTYPLQGTLETRRGPVRFLFLRSETIGKELAIVLRDPLPEGLRGQVRYKRHRSRDAWQTVAMKPGTFRISRRGRVENVSGLGVTLPSLQERAGKYVYFVEIGLQGEPMRSVTGDRPIYARYKAPVPAPVLVAHVLAIFLSLLLAIRTSVEALLRPPQRRLLQAVVWTLILGGFVLGPLVQWHAFGVWWSGWPFGHDWTDNKVVIGLLLWLAALWRNRGGRVCRWSIVLAGIVTLVIYFIPHSLFGSEYDYLKGTGHGTAG